MVDKKVTYVIERMALEVSFADGEVDYATISVGGEYTELNKEELRELLDALQETFEDFGKVPRPVPYPTPPMPNTPNTGPWTKPYVTWNKTKYEVDSEDAKAYFEKAIDDAKYGSGGLDDNSKWNGDQ